MKIIPGPDFPTGGIISNGPGISELYESGQGSILVRAKTHIETHNGGSRGTRQSIVITELPYMTVKSGN